MRRRLRVLTWHVHGSYLYYLGHAPVDFYVLSRPDRGPGYSGRWGHMPWTANIHDMPLAELHEHAFDCVLYQSHVHYLEDRALLSDAQQRLPAVFLEHDPPREHPVDTRHPVDDPDMLLVHVTHFNALMWDNGRTPTRVITHGVIVPPDVHYRGTLERGLTVVNHLARRGRRLGADVYAQVAPQVPLDLIGMAAEEAGGLGEVRHDRLPAFVCDYRFLFNPIRYTSLGLAVCEAMMLGVPIVGLGTTEMARVIENGVNGYTHTNIAWLVERMRELLADRGLAAKLGEGAQTYAREHFNIERFAREWGSTFEEVCANRCERGVCPSPAGGRAAVSVTAP